MSREEMLTAFECWYENQKRGKAPVPKGTIAGAMIVLQRLKSSYTLDLETHLTNGGAQVKNASGNNIKRLLAEFGETRPFVVEGGRTNRGLRSAVDTMLVTLAGMHLEQIPEVERVEMLGIFQKFLIRKIQEFHNRERLKFIYDPSMSVWQDIHNLLELARKENKAGPVAQHLVGAKLQLRFPGEKIGRESYSTADKQLGRPGDFCVGNTAFHVTMAPMPALYDKCERNLEEGWRPYLLVPDDSLVGVKQNINLSPGKGRITAASLEAFISQNIEELSCFSADRLAHGLYQLFQVYNERIDEIEIDKSLSIEIPQNLLRRISQGP